MTPLTDFVAECQRLAVGEHPTLAIAGAMQRLVAEPAVLAQHIPVPAEEVPQKPSGIDEVLFEDETVTVFVVHSRPGVLQPPHDHLISAVIGVYEGVEEQRYFRRDGDTIVPSGGATIETGEVLTLGASAIHAISAGSAWCRAVHVYLGSLRTSPRSLFDPVGFAEEPSTVERYEAFCRPVDTA